jgi:hypothetical protein
MAKAIIERADIVVPLEVGCPSTRNDNDDLPAVVLSSG